ncbi:MAG: cyclase family protein [Chloroflexi bacterium]|nr:cyclase family protein [Chloroflexota bacterium]
MRGAPRYDISIPITPTMPTYPGDPAVSIEPILQIAQGDAANVSRWSFGNHTGTHVDPPAHFIPGGITIDQLDLRTLYGAARVVDLTRVETIITARDLERARIPHRATRVLFKTRNSELWARPGFQKNFIALAPDAARWLVARKVKLVGIDYLSVEAFDARAPATHRTLLGAGVIVIEGLNLRDIAPGNYTLACLPLNVENGDGSPARAILIEK